MSRLHEILPLIGSKDWRDAERAYGLQEAVLKDLLRENDPSFRLGYLEGLFEPGMSWGNWALDGWHVDHIRPIASFYLSDPEQQARAFHFTNTRPMWAEHNLSKGAEFEGRRWRHGDHG